MTVKRGDIFEHTCASARWALMPCFLSGVTGPKLDLTKNNRVLAICHTGLNFGLGTDLDDTLNQFDG